MSAIGVATRRTFRSLRVRELPAVLHRPAHLQLGHLDGPGGPGLAGPAPRPGAVFDLGIVTGLQFLPILLFGPWGGLVADRMDKRRLLYVTAEPAAVSSRWPSESWWRPHAIQLWQVYLLAFCLGLMNLFDNPARQTFVFEMVGKEDLPNAVSLNSVVMNASRVMGPAVGGVVSPWSDWACAFWPTPLPSGPCWWDWRSCDRASSTRSPRWCGPRAAPRWVPLCLADALTAQHAHRHGRDRGVGLQLPGDAGTAGHRDTFHGGAGTLRAAHLVHGGSGRSWAGWPRPIGAGPRPACLRVWPSPSAALMAAGGAVPHAWPWRAVVIVFMGAASIAFIATANASLQLEVGAGHARSGHGPLRHGLPRHHADRRPLVGAIAEWTSPRVAIAGRRGRHLVGGADSAVALPAGEAGRRPRRPVPRRRGGRSRDAAEAVTTEGITA